MEKERIEFLYKQYFTGEATPEELLEWSTLLEDPVFQVLLAEVLETSYYEISPSDLVEMDRNRPEEILDYIIAHKSVQTPIHHPPLWPKILAVAAAIVAMIIGLVFFNYKANEGQTARFNATAHILPGKQEAKLTLANGKQISLTDAVNGVLAKEAGMRISKTSAGQISYELENQNDADQHKINTLATAKGETYMVILPDKSKVWLNAASSIKYPTSFLGADKRAVQLDGEAYFEISKDKMHPFVVHTAKQNVQVLGTHFNISAYGDEPLTKTTLLEGAVQVSSSQTGPYAFLKTVLKPGDQSAVSGSQIKVAEVETEDAVAWKNGLFIFDNETLETAMVKLSRWYDVRTVYQNSGIRNLEVGGSITRYENISKILGMFEKAGHVKFVISGKTITVSEK